MKKGTFCTPWLRNVRHYWQYDGDVLLCHHAIARLFDIPKTTKRIRLHATTNRKKAHRESYRAWFTGSRFYNSQYRLGINHHWKLVLCELGTRIKQAFGLEEGDVLHFYFWLEIETP